MSKRDLFDVRRGASLVATGNEMGFGSGPIHFTIRLGPGTPELAVQPLQESGAIEFNVNTPSGTFPILVQPAGPEFQNSLPLWMAQEPVER